MSEPLLASDASLSVESTSSIHAKTYSQAVGYYQGLRDEFFETRLTIARRVLEGLPTDTTRILDVGCGIGASTAIMREILGFTHAYGIDIAPAMVEASPPEFVSYGDYENEPIEDTTINTVTFAQAFIHVFPLERARKILKKMLRTTTHRIYLSTTVHDVDSEAFEQKEGTNLPRFRHRFTEESLLKLINSAIDCESSGSDLKWAFNVYHMKDPLGKLWFNVVIFSNASDRLGPPPYLRTDYQRDGFIVVRHVLDHKQVLHLQSTAENLKINKPPEGVNILRYAQRDTGIFDRVENFLPFTSIEDQILKDFVLPITQTLLDDQQCCVFKDKLNFKPPRFGKFPAHQDAAAGWSFGEEQQYLTAAIAVDASTASNGALELARASHTQGLLSKLHTTFSEELEASLSWERLDLAAGDCLFFDSFVPHRSSDNHTDSERRLLLITYQKWRENHSQERQTFFANKRFRQPTLDDEGTVELVKDSFGKWVRPDVKPNGAS